MGTSNEWAMYHEHFYFGVAWGSIPRYGGKREEGQDLQLVRDHKPGPELEALYTQRHVASADGEQPQPGDDKMITLQVSWQQPANGRATQHLILKSLVKQRHTAGLRAGWTSPASKARVVM